MKLYEIASTQFTARVDSVFSDMTLDLPFLDGREWEDMSQVPEQLKPLVYVITPTEGDYRGRSEMADSYKDQPELAFFVGVSSGSVYMQDLLNEPNLIMQISKRITPNKIMKLVQQHIVQDSIPQRSLN